MLSPLSPRCIWFAVRLCVEDVIEHVWGDRVLS